MQLAWLQHIKQNLVKLIKNVLKVIFGIFQIIFFQIN